MCNFPPEFLNWIYSYLTNRSQKYRIGSVLSNSTSVTSGVPQGSVLGPALFSIVIGSFTTLDKDVCLIKFADDVTIACPIYKTSDNRYVLDEYNNFLSWAAKFHLSVNENKTKCLPVSSVHNVCFCPLPIPFVSSIMLLGVTFTTNFNFNSHISNVVCSTTRKLFALRTVKAILPPYHCIIIYQGLIRSVLEYRSPLFS